MCNHTGDWEPYHEMPLEKSLGGLRAAATKLVDALDNIHPDPELQSKWLSGEISHGIRDALKEPYPSLEMRDDKLAVTVFIEEADEYTLAINLEDALSTVDHDQEGVTEIVAALRKLADSFVGRLAEYRPRDED
jgi:hypothetical protein